MYSVVKTATVSAGTGFKDIGAVVKVVIPDITLASASRVTVSMPSEWSFPGLPATVATTPVIGATPATSQITLVGAAAGSATDDSQISVAALGGAGKNFTINSNSTFDFIMAAPAAGESGANKYFYIYFNGINLNNMTGDLKVTFFAPNGSIFSTGVVTIGSSSRSGATLASIKEQKEIGAEGGKLDIISISELQTDTFVNGTITLKILTKGVTWDKTAATLNAAPAAGVAYGWDFAGIIAGNATGLAPATSGAVAWTNSDKNLEFTIPPALIAGADEPGRLSFANLPILIDEGELEAGDVIQVKISGADMTTTTLDVAKYAAYGLSVAEGTSKDVIAGKLDQEVGTFTIQESAFGSWIAGRTIKVTLPNGAVWRDEGDLDVLNDSDIGVITKAKNADNDCYTFTVPAAGASTNSGAKIEFNDFSVDLAPDFVGPLELKLSGSAGVTGTVKIADVKPAVTISVSETKNVNLGQANQVIGDITLTEGAAEGLLDNDLVLVLDDGYRWAKTPTVKVTEGNLDIDQTAIKLSNSDTELVIPIDSESSVASKIVISDCAIDAFRTAPEGGINLTVGSWNDGNRAVQEAANADWNDKSAGKAAIGICVTPAATTSSNASFYIGSTIMNVNGSNVVMDASPYIKAGRTYVPVRYLGDALGATTAWDAATQTVTVTKGDKTVVLVIGSKTAKVNGADVAMDVAPEITGGRTMLPARYVAEGLGYTVGWNASLQQVVIQ